MTSLLRDSIVRSRIESPVIVRITRAGSPEPGRCEPSNENLRQQARKESGDGRTRQGNLLLPDAALRSRSYERPNSAQNRLGVQIQSEQTPHRSTSLTNVRSRSSSPFDGIDRARLPTGSPTFERVMCEMLSESDLSPKTSDNEAVGENAAKKKTKVYTKTRTKTSSKRSKGLRIANKVVLQ